MKKEENMETTQGMEIPPTISDEEEIDEEHPIPNKNN